MPNTGNTPWDLGARGLAAQTKIQQRVDGDARDRHIPREAGKICFLLL